MAKDCLPSKSFEMPEGLSLNLAVLVLLAIPFFYFQFFGIPVQRGFFCDDESLSYPYRDSTIPTYALYITGFGFPIIVIIVTETIIKIKSGFGFSEYLKTVLDVMIGFGFGVGTCQLLTDISKYSIGRLRPHFFDVCRPNFDEIECSSRTYVTNYSCQGNYDLFHTDVVESRISDTHLSFVSGHASFSWQSSTFIVLYLYAKRKHNLKYNQLLIPFIQFLFIIYAFYTSLSRVTDNKHHPTDVIGGVIIGILSQVINVLFVTNLFPRIGSPGCVGNDEREAESLSMNIGGRIQREKHFS